MDEGVGNVSLSIALVAHDGMKSRLAEWALQYRDELSRHKLFATGTTGKMLREALNIPISLMKSGPHGGDAQLGALIAEDRLDILIFFTNPLTAQPHDVDVKALLRVAVLHDVVIAMNAATADFVLRSDYFSRAYQRQPLV